MDDGVDGVNPDDPFDGFVFDEDWAQSATLREDGLTGGDTAAPATPLRPRRRRLGRALSAVLRPSSVRTVMVVAMVVVGLSWANAANSGGGGSFLLGGGAGQRPTATAAQSEVALGVAPDPPPGPGQYEFMTLQDDDVTPVTYDPCRPIHIVVNDIGAPPQASLLLEDSLARMTEVTGLRFVVEGQTTEEATIDRSEFQRDRYGDRWAPVLVAWTDPETIPDLAGDIAGLAGSVAVQADGSWVYVSGLVYLDTPDFEQILDHPHGWEQARAIMLHELAHLVGLAHVDDQRELMAPLGHQFIVDFAPGDLAGLSRLGRGPCFDRL